MLIQYAYHVLCTVLYIESSESTAKVSLKWLILSIYLSCQCILRNNNKEGLSRESEKWKSPLPDIHIALDTQPIIQSLQVHLKQFPCVMFSVSLVAPLFERHTEAQAQVLSSGREWYWLRFFKCICTWSTDHSKEILLTWSNVSIM